MKITVTDLNAVKKSMEIEVGPEEVARETERAVRRYAQRVRVPGFRAGKVPVTVVKSRFGAEIREDVKDALLSRLYGEAARERGLRPVADPVLDEVRFEDGEPFRFKTTFEILPEITPAEYTGIEVRKREVEVGDLDVDKVVEDLRQSHARFVPSEDGGVAALGDVVVMDLEGAPEGGEPFRREGVSAEIGAADNLADFNAGIDGIRAGEERSFDVAYPESFHAEELRGKKVAYRVRAREVKRRELPEVGDEFARELGEFESLEALRARIREDLVSRRGAEADSEARRAVLDKVLLANPAPLPEVLVEREVQHRLEDMARSMILQGIDPSKLDLDWGALRSRHEEAARKAVHARLVLDAIAAAEGIDVEAREVDDRLRLEAQRLGESFEELRKRVRSQGGTEAIRNQLVREKTLDYLTSVANIQVGE